MFSPQARSSGVQVGGLSRRRLFLVWRARGVRGAVCLRRADGLGHHQAERALAVTATPRPRPLSPPRRAGTDLFGERPHCGGGVCSCPWRRAPFLADVRMRGCTQGGGRARGEAGATL